MVEPPARFSLTISLNVLEHLGINLYSNVPSVLSEIVANAWDADATKVHIDLDRKERIIIRDDGIGMTREEVNTRFLKVGYRRRDWQPGLTGKRRRPMGRKGIGKLSLFSIANSVQIETVKDGEISAFRMRLQDIREKINKKDGTGIYEPEEVEGTRGISEHGTWIILTDLHRNKTITTEKALRNRVARRFSIIGSMHNFHVFINNEEVVPADRGYYDKIQYLWTYGYSDDVKESCTKREKDEDRTTADHEEKILVTGWLGTVAESKQLKDKEGENLNRIAIFVRGKMAQDNILDDFSERGIYANYLIGELHFDDLDRYDGEGDEDEDAAISSRQHLVEDDQRYQQLRKFLSEELKHIQNRWSTWRGESGTKQALEIPAVKEWMENLNSSTRKKAEKWIGKINRIRLDNPEERIHLIKQAVIAFEFYQANESLDALDSIDDESLSTALVIFEKLDMLEANLYGQIVHQRLKVIRTIQEKVADNELEKVIQTYLFDHLWLLDPAWERSDGTAIMEQSVKSMFKDINGNLSKHEITGRLDIAYRKTAGQHVIVELKRPERSVTTADLIGQVGKYKGEMQKILDHRSTKHEPVEIVVLLGKEPEEWNSQAGKESSIKALEAYNTRIVFYDELLANAEKVYGDYFTKRKIVDKLTEVMKAIDDYGTPSSP